MGALNEAHSLDFCIQVFDFIGGAGRVQEIGPGTVLGRAVADQPTIAGQRVPDWDEVLPAHLDHQGQIADVLVLHIEAINDPFSPVEAGAASVRRVARWLRPFPGFI